jgi:hypothetical protein
VSVEEDSGGFQVSPDPAHDADLLVYDASKYLLTLCLLILGAVLTLSETAVADVPPAALLIVIGFLAISGFLSISCISQVIAARFAGKPARYIRNLNRFALAFLGAGVGGFMVVWVEQLL